MRPWLLNAVRAFQVEARLAWLSACRGFVSFRDSHDLTFASSVAYYSLLSLFPSLLLLLSLLGRATADPAQRAAVIGFVFQYFPSQVDFVRAQLEALGQTRAPLGLVGSVLVVWAALGFFSALNLAVNHAWGVTEQRGFVRHRLMSFLMLIAAGLVTAAALALFSVAGVVRSEAPWVVELLTRLPWLGFVGGIVIRYAATLVLITMLGFLFYFVPNAPVRLRDVWLGAILTGLLWRVALSGFSWYIRDLSRFSVHGSVATVVVFLLWVFISGVILLYGVEFTAAHAHLRQARPAHRS